jgi:hypothetical protein
MEVVSNRTPERILEERLAKVERMSLTMHSCAAELSVLPSTSVVPGFTKNSFPLEMTYTVQKVGTLADILELSCVGLIFLHTVSYNHLAYT